MSGNKCNNLRIFLLRHGKPAFPDMRSYLYGHTDYPLSDVGVRQAERIGAALADVPMGRIVSSDLSRAVQTAGIVASFQAVCACRIEQDPALREIDMGEWDGRTKEEIGRVYADLFRMRGEDLANAVPPGGESFAQLQRRALDALERIAAGCDGVDNLLLVAHGGLFWSMISGLFHIPLGDMMRFELDFGGLHLLDRNRTTGWYRLIRYNWFPDLTDS